MMEVTGSVTVEAGMDIEDIREAFDAVPHGAKVQSVSHSGGYSDFREPYSTPATVTVKFAWTVGK